MVVIRGMALVVLTEIEPPLVSNQRVVEIVPVGTRLVAAGRHRFNDELLKSDVECKTWRNRSLVEAWSGIFKSRTRRFWDRFPYYSTTDSTRSWLTAFVAIHNAALLP